MKILTFIDFGIFPGSVMFTVGYGADEVKKHLRRMKAPEWIRSIEGDEHRFGKGYHALHRELLQIKTGLVRHYYHIILEKFEFTDECYIRLAHECLHLCSFHLRDILDRNREFEADAYTHSHLMRQCLDKIRS